MRSKTSWTGWIMLAITLFVLAFSSVSEAACSVDPSVALAVTKLNWTFDPRSGMFRLEAEVQNVSKTDVVGPGIAVTLVDGEGKDLDYGVARSRTSRIRPEEKATAKLVLKVLKMPGTVKVSPFQGIAGT